jgi:hypothetical protein
LDAGAGADSGVGVGPGSAAGALGSGLVPPAGCCEGISAAVRASQATPSTMAANTAYGFVGRGVMTKA